jgi:hypothetical protein
MPDRAMADPTFSTALKLAPKTVAAIDAAVTAGASHGFRPHLGASQIGRRCERALWYMFRWATRAKFGPRMLRLFARGQREEAIVSALLRSAGLTVHQIDPHTGKQFEFADCGGHFGGSMDGAIHRVPDAPTTWHVWENKTASKKSFDQLVTQGVKAAKPEHWAQMQCYLHWSGMTRALYTAICKDDDRIHAERIDYDEAEAMSLIAKAQRVIDATTPPERISGPESFDCRWCEHREICHTHQAPELNCRTCIHSTPESDSTWSCSLKKVVLDTQAQHAGCDHHRYIPETIHWAHVVEINLEENSVLYQDQKTNKQFMNAAPPEGFLSREIRAAKDKAILGVAPNDPTIMDLRRQFGGEIIG